MNNRILQICKECAVANAAEWKNPKNSAPLMLSSCNCCNEIKPIVHINFWKGITPESNLKPFKAQNKTAKTKTVKVKNDRQ